MLSILVNLKKQAQERLQEQEQNDDKENQSTNVSKDSTICKDGSIRLANDTLQQSLNDSVVVQGLIDIVCVLWMSRCQELAQKENAEYRSLLEKKSSKILFTNTI